MLARGVNSPAAELRPGSLRIQLCASDPPVQRSIGARQIGDAQPQVSVVVCTGSSCDSRCNFSLKRAFEDLAAEGESLAVTEVNCMNMCKRGPAVRLVADGLVTTVEARMNALEMKRTAFQSVSSARVSVVHGVAQGIANGSFRDSYGEFAATTHGPLSPSAM